MGASPQPCDRPEKQGVDFVAGQVLHAWILRGTGLSHMAVKRGGTPGFRFFVLSGFETCAGWWIVTCAQHSTA